VPIIRLGNSGGADALPHARIFMHHVSLYAFRHLYIVGRLYIDGSQHIVSRGYIMYVYLSYREMYVVTLRGTPIYGGC
jgi:hypothetical protein